MKAIRIGLVGVFAAAAVAMAGDKPEHAGKSCAEYFSESAKIPEKASETLASVADMYEAHLKWIGTKPGAKDEHANLTKAAKTARELSKGEAKFAQQLRDMRGMKDALTHDMSSAEVQKLSEISQRVAQQERELAQLLNTAADENEKMSQDYKSAGQGVGGSGEMKDESGMGGSGTEGQMKDESKDESGMGGSGEVKDDSQMPREDESVKQEQQQQY